MTLAHFKNRGINVYNEISESLPLHLSHPFGSPGAHLPNMAANQKVSECWEFHLRIQVIRVRYLLLNHMLKKTTLPLKRNYFSEVELHPGGLGWALDRARLSEATWTPNRSSSKACENQAHFQPLSNTTRKRSLKCALEFSVELCWHFFPLAFKNICVIAEMVLHCENTERSMCS